jgi:hypothetical protein
LDFLLSWYLRANDVPTIPGDIAKKAAARQTISTVVIWPPHVRVTMSPYLRLMVG